jgi:YteA family regulatory protein
MTNNTQFKIILENQKDELLKTINGSKSYLRTPSDELSSYDNHPGDTGTEIAEKEKEMALTIHNNAELQKIELALKAIEDGSYGKCKVCGKEIPNERLEALPSSLYCIDHAEEKEIPEDRPNEEATLKELFDTKYDHNDSFSEVASFGTSETPSDFKDSADHYDEFYNQDLES